VFGFLSKDYFVYVLYLGIGPGIFGHTMLSTLLKYISPLIVSTAMLGEPITGSIIGHIFGLQPMPELYTWIGGGVLLLGLVLVVTGESQSDNEEQDTKGCDSVDQSLQQTINKEDYGTLNDTNLI
jgi:drug/metabolite transporter (DMT)-like permease